MDTEMSYEHYPDAVKRGILMDNGLCPAIPLL